jgi:hypothetical protein
MSTTPCNQVPVKYVDCCSVMDCINITSPDNSITVEKDGCGVSLTQTGNNLDQILLLQEGDCVTFVKEFVEGKLVITPQLDWDCIATNVCELCSPVIPVSCSAPISLSVEFI